MCSGTLCFPLINPFSASCASPPSSSFHHHHHHQPLNAFSSSPYSTPFLRLGLDTKAVDPGAKTLLHQEEEGLLPLQKKQAQQRKPGAREKGASKKRGWRKALSLSRFFSGRLQEKLFFPRLRRERKDGGACVCFSIHQAGQGRVKATLHTFLNHLPTHRHHLRVRTVLVCVVVVPRVVHVWVKIISFVLSALLSTPPISDLSLSLPMHVL